MSEAPEILSIFVRHRERALRAYVAFVGLCEGQELATVAGTDTIMRLAVRIDAGADIERAAATEYLYRWRLAIEHTAATGAPHTLGL